MAFDLATARVRAGLTATDTSQDAAIVPLMDFAVDLAERYCQQLFFYRETSQRFAFVSPERAVYLARLPVETVLSVTIGGWPAGPIEVDRTTGRVALSLYPREEVIVTYRGGWRPLPVTLEQALWAIFDGVWSTQQTAGAAGGATFASAAIGSIKSIAADGMRVEYVTEQKSGTEAASGEGLFYYIPDGARALLDFFRREVLA